MRDVLRRAHSVVAGGGLTALAQRASRLAYRRLGAAELDFPLFTEDIADSRRIASRPPAPAVPLGRPLTVGWVTTPPGIGSGGHTTMFRMVSAFERAGHRCVLYLYDRYGGDLAAQTQVIRAGWPEVRATVRDARAGIAGTDACVATSWQTAHVLARSTGATGHLFYFIQDFEPFFTGRGTEYELAEDTYRFGFTNIALGEMVHGCLNQIGVPSEVVPFGCDTNTYHLLDSDRDRRGVVFYARPGTSRRGFVLGVLALREFHERYPDQPIHLYGARPTGLPFPAELHGNMRPHQLNGLYNEVLGGLALSFTNISLVAEEMLAAGAIPVVNDSRYSRADLPSNSPVWVPATPSGLADGLSYLVGGDSLTRARKAAASVRADNWLPTGDRVVEIVTSASRQSG